MGKRNNQDEGYCLVLGGGGAKGIYHLGVWRALKELKVPVRAFYGNSIGAIVAGFLCQGDEAAMERFGAEAGLDYVIRIPDRLISGGELKITPQNADLFRAFYNRSLKKGGLDTAPLRLRLDRDLSEEAIRASGKDLGIVTFNLTDFKPCQIYLEQMPPGTVIDYLMASSAVPGFKSPEIGGKKFVDGGVADNLPWKMARERGWRKIIVVDISGLGVSRKPDTEGTVTVHIKNSIDMGGILDFNPDFLARYRELGYLDTLKTFGRLKGHEYFIEPPVDYGKAWGDLFDNALPVLVRHLGKGTAYETLIPALRKILPPETRMERELLYPLADCAASILRLERIRKYKYAELVKALRTVRKGEDAKLERIRKDLAGQKSADLMVRLTTLAGSYKKVTEGGDTPYFQYRLAEKILKKTLPGAAPRDLLRFFPKLAAGILFLELLDPRT